MKAEHGSMPCRECGAEVKVMKADNGTLSYRCLARGCDDADYARAGSLKNASWMKRIKPFNDAVIEPSSKTETAQKSHSIFGAL